ncbi:MAG: RNA methyltransferase, partial [Pedococcus sp.]
MADLIITSPSNPRLKALAALRRRRTREQTGQTLIEGYEELTLALDAGVRPEALYYCPELMLDTATQTRVVDDIRRSGVDTVQVSRAAFEKAAYREGPDGFIAVVPAVVRTCADLTVGPNALTVLCQGVEKPGNLGAMLRTADAAGVEAVIAADPVTDWGNPNLVRASKGTVFSVPVASDSTMQALAWLDDRGIALVATTPDTDLDHTDIDYTGPVAIAVG